jgi:hypothetical protein
VVEVPHEVGRGRRRPRRWIVASVALALGALLTLEPVAADDPEAPPAEVPADPSVEAEAHDHDAAPRGMAFVLKTAVMPAEVAEAIQSRIDQPRFEPCRGPPGGGHA